MCFSINPFNQIHMAQTWTLLIYLIPKPIPVHSVFYQTQIDNAGISFSLGISFCLWLSTPTSMSPVLIFLLSISFLYPVRCWTLPFQCSFILSICKHVFLSLCSREYKMLTMMKGSPPFCWVPYCSYPASIFLFFFCFLHGPPFMS